MMFRGDPADHKALERSKALGAEVSATAPAVETDQGWMMQHTDPLDHVLAGSAS